MKSLCLILKCLRGGVKGVIHFKKSSEQVLRLVVFFLKLVLPSLG
jgi:hypothetical protein